MVEEEYPVRGIKFIDLGELKKFEISWGNQRILKSFSFLWDIFP